MSLVSHDESGLLRDIRKLLKQEIAISDVAGFEPSTPLRLDAGAPRPVQGQRQPRPARNGHASHGGNHGQGRAPANAGRNNRRRSRPAGGATRPETRG